MTQIPLFEADETEEEAKVDKALTAPIVVEKSDTVFGSDDWRYFYISEPKSRFEALRYILLPRLFTLVNHAIALIRGIYAVDALADSAVAFSPQPRKRREKEVDFFYELCSAGLGSRRTQNKWIAVERKNGDPVQILPYRFEFILDADGLGIQLSNYWVKGMSMSSYRMAFDFLLANESRIHHLLHFAEAKPNFDWRDSGGPLVDSRVLFERLIKRGRPHYDLISVHRIGYPIGVDKAWQAIITFMALFPIYWAYLEIAMGREPSFCMLYDRLQQWATQKLHGPTWRSACSSDELGDGNPVDQEIAQALQSMAHERVLVVPNVRWQVFQRDGFKCRSCGRSADDGAVLQIDHIEPKSWGGPDVFANYQTLCRECNLGKSNRSNESFLDN